MKIFSLSILLFIMIFLQTVQACETGFACSLDNLFQLQNEQDSLIYRYIDNLFKKEINEDLFFAHPFYSKDYNDLFVFKSIL